MDKGITILSTRTLGNEYLEKAAEKNLEIIELPFITIDPFISVDIQQEIESALLLSATVVFTSQHSVEAVAQFLDGIPDWRIYCIGQKTRQLVEEYFGDGLIAGTADYGLELAEKIVEDGVSDVIYFCGNQRRDELPGYLQDNDVELVEIVVYSTLLLEHKIDEEYFGVLFFSPSAVTAFFKHNRLSVKTIVFAIGDTTAREIKKYTENKIIIAPVPETTAMAEQVIEYFAG